MTGNALPLCTTCNERITEMKKRHCSREIACPLQMIVSVDELPPDEFDRHFTDSGYAKSYGPTVPVPIETPEITKDDPGTDLLLQVTEHLLAPP